MRGIRSDDWARRFGLWEDERALKRDGRVEVGLWVKRCC